MRDIDRQRMMDYHDRTIRRKWKEQGGPDLTPSKHTLTPAEVKLKKKMEADFQKFVERYK